jgi:hypothetical protein
MNKFILGILLSSVTFSTGFDRAVAATDTVDVTATIQPVLNVVVSANSNDLNVTPGTAVIDQNIATITINSNNSAGYDVTLASDNASSVANSTGTASAARRRSTYRLLPTVLFPSCRVLRWSTNQSPSLP